MKDKAARTVIAQAERDLAGILVPTLRRNILQTDSLPTSQRAVEYGAGILGVGKREEASDEAWAELLIRYRQGPPKP